MIFERFVLDREDTRFLVCPPCLLAKHPKNVPVTYFPDLRKAGFLDAVCGKMHINSGEDSYINKVTISLTGCEKR